MGLAHLPAILKEKEGVIAYIIGKKKHHKRKTFYDEYKWMLMEDGVHFNGKYML